MEDRAAQYIKGGDKRLLYALEKNAALWKAAGAVRDSDQFFPREYNPEVKQRQAMDQVIDRTDGAMVFWNGDHTSRAFAGLAEAARQGKALRVYGPDGKEANLFDVVADAKMANQSKKEYAQSQSLPAFEIPASEPMARVALSLVRDEKLGTFSPKDMNAITTTESTINELSDMAKTDHGREYLLREAKVSTKGVGLLANENVMSSARTAFLKINKEISDAGLDVIGPQDYPEAMLHSGNVPPFLLVKGDKDFFRNANAIVGMTGAPVADETVGRMVNAQATKAVSAVTSEKVVLAYVQGQMPVDVPVTGPQILVSTKGAEHASEAEAAKQAAVVEAGGAVVFEELPKNANWVYNAQKVDPKTRKKGVLSPIESKGGPHAERRAARLVAAMSDTLVVTNISAAQPASPQHSGVLQALKSGRLPAVTNFSEYGKMDAVSGNQALLSGRGAAALTRAGFGSSDIEPMATAIDGRKPAMDTGRNITKAMQNVAAMARGETPDLPKKAKTRETADIEM